MRRSFLVAALILVAPGVRADSKATAEVLYEQGKALLRDGKYDQACPKFAASHETDPSMGALLHLADCQEKVGRLTTAWATFREAVSFANRTKDERVKIAEERAKKLEGRLPHMVFSIQGEQPGLVVKRNGEVVTPATFGAPLPVDPGDQKIEAIAPRKKPFLASFTVREGQTLAVLIPALPDEAPEPAPRASASASPSAPASASAPSTPPPVAPAASPNPSGKTLGLALGAVGVVGLGVGSYFGLKARSDWSDSRPMCEGKRCSHEGAVLAQDARSAGNLSTLSFLLGSAALGAGAYFFFAQGSSGVQVGGVAAPSGGLVSLKGIY